MLKLGVVGFSDGNGHPFSWAAACNGYLKKKLNKIPFVRIRDYLPKYDLDFIKINDAKVTHIWTQDRNYSKLIAEITKINYVCLNLRDLYENVDAILFLRDDIETREKYLLELIKSGKPIYVDKFLHYDQKKIKKYLKLQRYSGQIFSEAPVVNYIKLKLTKLEFKEIGKIVSITCHTPGKWKLYSVNSIEPCLQFIKNKKIKNIKSYNSELSSNVTIKWQDDLTTTFSSTQNSNVFPSTILIGSKKHKEVIWDHDFTLDVFLSTLRKFIFSVKNKANIKNEKDHFLIAKIVKAGLIK